MTQQDDRDCLVFSTQVGRSEWHDAATFNLQQWEQSDVTHRYGVEWRLELFFEEVDKPRKEGDPPIVAIGAWVDGDFDDLIDLRCRQLLVEAGCLLNTRWCLFHGFMAGGERYYQVDISRADLLPLRMRLLDMDV